MDAGRSRLTFFALFQGYVAYTVARRGVACAASELQYPPLGFTKSDLGTVQSCFTTTYGISKMMGSILSDRFSCRLLFTIGLAIAAASNALVLVSDSVLLFSVCWCINGAVQGLGWPSLAQIIIQTYAPATRGSVWGMLTISGNVAKTLSPLVLSYAMHLGGWRFVFLTAASLGTCSAVVSWLCLGPGKTCTGISVEATSPSEACATASTPDVASKGDDSLLHRHGFGSLVRSLNFWALVLANLSIYFVLQALSDWIMPMLKEAHELPPSSSAFCLAAYEAGGVAGSVTAGIVSDLLGGEGNRNLTSLCYTAALTPTILVLWSLPVGLPAFVHASLLFAVGFVVYGPKTLGGITAREDHRKVAGVASGILALAGQWGATASGFPMGRLLEWYSWNGFFAVLVAASSLSLVLYIQLCFSQVRPSVKAKSE